LVNKHIIGRLEPNTNKVRRAGNTWILPGRKQPRPRQIRGSEAVRAGGRYAMFWKSLLDFGVNEWRAPFRWHGKTLGRNRTSLTFQALCRLENEAKSTTGARQMARMFFLSNHRKYPGVKGIALIAIASIISTPCVTFAQRVSDTTIGSPQDAESGQLGEIIVTAQKRAQTAQSTPLAITALDANALETHQVASLEDLSQVSPGVVIGQDIGVNRLFIRGIGLNAFSSGADPSSAFYVDGIYIGTAAGQLTSFYDVDRVEVVRGPQGTLYGRNATGGAVNLISRAPTEEASGYLDATFGNYGLYQFEGALSGPLTKDGTLLGRVAFQTIDHNGYGQNVTLGYGVDSENRQAVKATLEYKPTDSMRFTLIGEFFHQRDNDYFIASFGAYPGYTLLGQSLGYLSLANQRDQATLTPQPENQRQGEAVTLTSDFDLNEYFQLKSITGWREFDRANGWDIDDSSAPLSDGYLHEQEHQTSEELQLAFKGGGLDAIGGLYFYHETLANQTFFPFSAFGPGLTYLEDGTMDIKAYAAYSQATYTVVPRLRLTGGIRYSKEDRSTDGVFQGVGVPAVPTDAAKSWSAFTPKGGIEFDVAEDVLAYGSVTKGFKSGTFNIGQDNPPIDPEKILAYETGLKARALDRRLEMSGSVFYYDYTDLQVNKIIGITTLTTNAAAAIDKGIEFAARAKATSLLTLDGDVTFLHARFTDFTSVNPLTPTAPAENLDGNLLPGAPKWASNLGAELALPLAVPGRFALRVDGSYFSRVYFTEFNDPNLSQAGYVKVNAFLRYTSASDKWTVSLWGKNVTDRMIAGVKTLGIAGYGYPIYGSYEPPATYGITLGAKF
jgi:iron complex outermembrane receptor protein